MYKVTFDRLKPALYNLEKEYFEPGEIVRFSIPNITDTSFSFSSAQVDIKPDPEVSRGYCFVMPECDVDITVKENSTMVCHGVVDAPFMGVGFMNMGSMMDVNGKVPPNPSIPTVKSKFCPECGAVNKEASKFCEACGNAF